MCGRPRALAWQQGVTIPSNESQPHRSDRAERRRRQWCASLKSCHHVHEIADATFNAMHQMLGNKGIMDLILLILYYHFYPRLCAVAECRQVPRQRCGRGEITGTDSAIWRMQWISAGKLSSMTLEQERRSGNSSSRDLHSDPEAKST